MPIGNTMKMTTTATCCMLTGFAMGPQHENDVDGLLLGIGVGGRVVGGNGDDDGGNG